MAAVENELELKFGFLPYIKAYKNGHVERLKETHIVPAGTDPTTGVTSKDITNIIPNTKVYLRIYLPKISSSNEKLPLLVYYHGGAFLVHTPSTPLYHNYLNALVAESRVIAISVHYRRAPEHHLPIAYEDSWAALHWVATHCNSDGPEPILNHHVDFRGIFLAGDSASGNIVHNLAMAARNPDGGRNVGILGIVLVDLLFWGSDPIGLEGSNMEKKACMNQLWGVVCPSCPTKDPWINSVAEGGLSLVGLGCWRVLVTDLLIRSLSDRSNLKRTINNGNSRSSESNSQNDIGE